MGLAIMILEVNVMQVLDHDGMSCTQAAIGQINSNPGVKLQIK